MERGYNADGWLGFICGAKMYYEFSIKYPFEQKMPSLMKEIIQLVSKDGSKEGVAPDIIPVKAAVVCELLLTILFLL